jgi:hypothetical protein
MSNVITKSEVVKQLADMLRDDTISDVSFLKLMVAMCRLQGWITK